MTQPPWSARLVKLIAGEIKRWRDARGMSAQQLADACEKLGHPVPRSVLANLESGRRETISIPELLVLARALEVPAAQLVFPIGSTTEVEILPGRTVSTEQAMLWFAGWHDLFRDEATTQVGHGHQDPQSGLHEWYETPYADASAPVHLYAEHRQLVKEYESAADTVRHRLPGEAIDSEAFRDEVARIRTNAERAIRYQRSEMRRRGITVLPDLPPGLEHLR